MESAPASHTLMRRALEIACAALDEPEADRARWALRECGDDPTLRAEVASLLAADHMPDDGFTRTSGEPAADPWPGRLIGRYRIGSRIGSGGMGAVYRAEPESGVTRQPVALKLIKLGMDSEEIVRRFLREREILARLDHPHIARLLDGGISDDGRPWFAMELVGGQPLLEYCDQRRLGLAARIDLFIQVCEAVDYAHHLLVVHRDIKPGNVLVTDQGETKLLDFGIAKLIDASGEAATRSMLAIMTPEYAAPEQYEHGYITTQTDVYLLGLLLAELLTGKRPPWPVRSEVEAGISPARLDAAFSVRAAATDPALVELAARRGCSVGALARALRGDLDRIVRRAMAYEPERRYASAAALADDLLRHRRGEPVLAMDDSWVYRVRKFVQRHRAGVAATVAVVVALALGAGATLRETARLRVSQAHTETTLALLEDVFLGANPYSARGGDTRASDLLDGARVRIESHPDLPPALAARLWLKLGTAYVSLDERTNAEGALRAAVAASERALACRGLECIDVDTAALRIDQAAARSRLAHYQLVVDGNMDGLPALEAAIADLRAAGAPGRQALAKALNFLCDHEFNLGRYDNLDRLSAEMVALEEAAGGEYSPSSIMALGVRASLLRATGRVRDALQEAAEAHRRVLTLGEAAPPGVRLYAEQQYAAALSFVGKSAAAEPVLRAARDRAQALRGRGSGIALGLTWDLAEALSDLGQYPQAIAELHTLQRLSINIKGANAGAIHNAMGSALLGNGDAEAALIELAAARSILCDARPPSPPCVAVTLNQIDAELGLVRLEAARRDLDRMRELALAAKNRAAMRWHWLESRWQLQRGNTTAAEQALAASRAALTDEPGPIEQGRWLQQDALIAIARGNAPAALASLAAAERHYRSRWVGEPPALRDVRAGIDALTR